MAGNTPFRNYPHPTYGDAANFPAQQQAFAVAVDTDLFNNLTDAINDAQAEPSARASRPTGSQAIANATNVTLSYTVEDYDNNAIVNLAGSNTNFVITTPGTYLVSGSVNMSPDGAAGGSAALILTTTGAILNPGAVSRQLDNDKDTSLTYTTLYRITTVPETLTQIVRHNHGASLNATIAQLTVTRISG